MTIINANLSVSSGEKSGLRNQEQGMDRQDYPTIPDAEITPEIRAAGDAFTRYLWAEIPICERMEITALPVSRERFILAAPLQPNRNVHGTAFAGSIYTVMSMSGWGLVRAELDRRVNDMVRVRADLWLTKANIRYLEPVTTGFHAIAEIDGKSLDHFWEKLVRKGRGKIRLNTVIGNPKQPLVLLQGEYAAKLVVDEMGV